MQSSLIGKIEKAKRYAKETDRVTFSDFSVKFRGEHDTYSTSLKDSRWHCTCDFFSNWKTCSHTMAMERIMGKMLPHEALANQAVPALT